MGKCAAKRIFPGLCAVLIHFCVGKLLSVRCQNTSADHFIFKGFQPCIVRVIDHFPALRDLKHADITDQHHKKPGKQIQDKAILTIILIVLISFLFLLFLRLLPAQLLSPHRFVSDTFPGSPTRSENFPEGNFLHSSQMAASHP